MTVACKGMRQRARTGGRAAGEGGARASVGGARVGEGGGSGSGVADDRAKCPNFCRLPPG
jgi:hypothetical protein